MKKNLKIMAVSSNRYSTGTQVHFYTADWQITPQRCFESPTEASLNRIMGLINRGGGFKVETYINQVAVAVEVRRDPQV